MKPLLLATIFSLFIFEFGYSQNDFDKFVDELDDLFNRPVITVTRQVETTGTPYLTENAMRGSLIKDRSKTENVSIMYNLLDDTFEIEKGDKFYIIETKYLSGLDIVYPNKMSFRNGFPKSEKENIENSTMFQVIYDGKIKMLRRDYASLIKGVASYGSTKRNDVIDTETKFYILIDNEYKEVRLKRRNILRAFDKSKRKDIQNYAKRFDLSYDDYDDLKSLLKHAETL